jgi:translation initiation factor 2B subunit (eIF-2B alpha/beta/delta family)
VRRIVEDVGDIEPHQVRAVRHTIGTRHDDEPHACKGSRDAGLAVGIEGRIVQLRQLVRADHERGVPALSREGFGDIHVRPAIGDGETEAVLPRHDVEHLEPRGRAEQDVVVASEERLRETEDAGRIVEAGRGTEHGEVCVGRRIEGPEQHRDASGRGSAEEVDDRRAGRIEGVPSLAAHGGYRMQQMSWEELRAAASDRRSGSAVVASSAARAFCEIARSSSPDEIVEAAQLIVSSQPLMASCLRLADVVLRALDENDTNGAARAAETYAQRLDDERISLVKQLAERLPTEGTVVTVSASSLVIDALKSVPRLRVLCAVSEPGGEGRDAADALIEAGMEAALIPDGSLAQQSARADAVVFGADAIGPEGLLNKTGTFAAALGARTARRPCICVAASSKLVDQGLWPILVDASERVLSDGIPIFEEVPLSLVPTIVLENGTHTQRMIRRLARNARMHPSVVAWLGP